MDDRDDNHIEDWQSRDPAAEAAGAPPSEDAVEVSELCQLQAEIEELRDANLRIRAEFDNYRRRTARERLDITDRARADVIVRLLPVLDSIERALRAAEEQGVEQPWVEGLRMVHQQFLSALADEGVEPIECLGQLFDPTCHEAVATVANELVPRGYITSELQRGYRLGELVLRPSQVVASEGDPAHSDEGDGALERGA